KKAGSYPKDYSVFQGQKDFFNASTLYDPTQSYLTGQQVYIVVLGNKLYYKARGGVPPNNPPPAPLYWDILNFTPTVDYSPLTKNKAQYWINAGAGWYWAGSNGQGTTKCGVVDPNII